MKLRKSYQLQLLIKVWKQWRMLHLDYTHLLKQTTMKEFDIDGKKKGGGWGALIEIFTRPNFGKQGVCPP